LFDQILMAIAPDPKDIIVIGGAYSGRDRSAKGTKHPSILKALLKHLEARRRVVYVDEYNTSQFCPECDTRLVYHSNREKRCDECKTVWNRDLVGALNQKKVFEYWWQHGERPAHLCRPAAPESTPGAAAATARRSRKRRAAASDLDPDPDLDTTGGATDSAPEDAQQPGGPPARRRAKLSSDGAHPR